MHASGFVRILRVRRRFRRLFLLAQHRLRLGAGIGRLMIGFCINLRKSVSKFLGDYFAAFRAACGRVRRRFAVAQYRLRPGAVSERFTSGYVV